MIARTTLIGIAALLGSLCSTAAYADDCIVPAAAMRLIPTKSYTVVMITTRDGKTQTHDAVLAGGYLYIQLGGVWRKTTSAAQMLDDVNNGLKTSKMTCKRAGSETVSGQPTTVYMVHDVNQGGTSDNRLWISAAGLPLKTEANLGAEGGLVVSTYDYSHAAVPLGVK